MINHLLDTLTGPITLITKPAVFLQTKKMSTLRAEVRVHSLCTNIPSSLIPQIGEKPFFPSPLLLYIHTYSQAAAAVPENEDDDAG